jgi:GT2 family glycosyltransferase
MRETKLSDAIWSVVRQSFGKKNYEIIIVDNSPLSGGARETATYFKEKYAEFDGFIKYVEVLHKGLSFARNAGIWAASGKILLFLDDDVLADYHLIEEIFSAFKYHENAGIIGGQVILDVPFPRPEVARHGYETLWSQLKVQYSTYKEVTQNFEFPYGANFAIRRDLALKIGGFSTSYGRVGKDYSGGEETAMSFKAQQLGYAVGIEPRAKVLHRVDLDRFTKEHVRKTIKSVIFTVYRFFLDMYIDVGWTKKYVRNQVKICLKEARHFKKRGITGIELYYKICYLEAWGDLLKQMEKNKP